MKIIPEYELIDLDDILYYSILLRQFDEDVDDINDFDYLMFVASFDLTDSLDFDNILKYINNSYDIASYRFIYSKKGKVLLNVVVYG